MPTISPSWIRAVLLTTALTATACGAMRQGPAVEPETTARAADVPMEYVQQTFTDENVAAVLTAMNLMEIHPSELALERTQNRMVREYAQRMIEEHARVQGEMQQMLAAKGMQPQHNALSITATRNLEPVMANLREKRGADFDKEYLLQQIASHQGSLHTLDTTLIPATRDPDLRNYLTTRVRPGVARHLEEVKRLHARLVMDAGA